VSLKDTAENLFELKKNIEISKSEKQLLEKIFLTIILFE